MGQTKRLARAALVTLTLVIVTAPAASAAASRRSGAGPAADRRLHVVYESAVYNPVAGNVNFTVLFDRRPSCCKVDSYGRRADTFQYFIVGDDTLSYPQTFDAIIRGGELPLRSRRLPIRNSVPSDPDPAAGGWGAIRATVPFRLHRRVLRFSAPLSALSDHSTDGRFSYTLQTYRFGALVDSIVSESVVRSRRPPGGFGPQGS